LYPDAAQTCAMPDPIRPHPSTPTVLICIDSSKGPPEGGLHVRGVRL
jgi:hypothetical protein